jgi:hypothetical protein
MIFRCLLNYLQSTGCWLSRHFQLLYTWRNFFSFRTVCARSNTFTVCIGCSSLSTAYGLRFFRDDFRIYLIVSPIAGIIRMSLPLSASDPAPTSSYIQEVLGRTNRLLSLIRHGPHWKRRVQQFFCCRVCIRYRSNVSTQPLPSNDRVIFTELLSSNDKGIYTEPLPSNDRGIFTEPLPSNDRGIHIQTHRLMGRIF